jgi:hypothetical protein
MTGKCNGPGVAGLCDWAMLSPNELKRVARRIADVVKFGSEPSRRLGLVALVSLATGLPARMALRLPFSDNGDVWIDVESGECVWDIQAIVTRERLSDSILAGGRSPYSGAMRSAEIGGRFTFCHVAR